MHYEVAIYNKALPARKSILWFSGSYSDASDAYQGIVKLFRDLKAKAHLCIVLRRMHGTEWVRRTFFLDGEVTEEVR